MDFDQIVADIDSHGWDGVQPETREKFEAECARRLVGKRLNSMEMKELLIAERTARRGALGPEGPSFETQVDG